MWYKESDYTERHKPKMNFEQKETFRGKDGWLETIMWKLHERVLNA